MTAPPNNPSSLDSAGFWNTFSHHETLVEGSRLHYVMGGSGRPILLLPGWPQSWFAWRRVMPLLAAQGRQVIALDLRGLGDSDKSGTYDLTTIAAEVHAFIRAARLTSTAPLDIAAHDIGVWVAYAHASDFPQDVHRLALLDAALPGITPPPPAGIPSHEAGVRTWHFAFNRLHDLPEMLIEGKERQFLNWMFQQKARNATAFDDEALDEYTRIFEAPGAAKAGFDYYRAAFSPEGLEASQDRARKHLAMPVLTIGAEAGVGHMLADTLQEIADDVKSVVIADHGHYLPEEAPEPVAKELLAFFA